MVLADGAALGDRFVALAGAPTDVGWVTAEELFGAGLPAALDDVGAARGTSSPAVAGALMIDVYAQRVAAPVIAAFHVEGRLLDAGLSQVRVEPRDGRFGRIAFARPAVDAPPHAEQRMREGLIAGLEPAVDAVHRETRVGRRVLRGSVAHAVAITYLHLSWPGTDRARHVPTARAFLDGTGLAGLVDVEEVWAGGEAWMYSDRNTCCLAFRTTENQARAQRYCATCPVLPRETTRDMFGRATASYAERHPRP